MPLVPESLGRTRNIWSDAIVSSFAKPGVSAFAVVLTLP
jgi:hypothetical protein